MKQAYDLPSKGKKKQKKREFLVRYEILKLKSRHNVAPW